jgi:hypothetical protein
LSWFEIVPAGCRRAEQHAHAHARRRARRQRFG